MDVWSSSYDYLRFRGRLVARSRGRSVARSLGRSVARSLSRSFDCSLRRSIARSLDHSITRSLGRSGTRAVGRSLDRSVARSVNDMMPYIYIYIYIHALHSLKTCKRVFTLGTLVLSRWQQYSSLCRRRFSMCVCVLWAREERSFSYCSR